MYLVISVIANLDINDSEQQFDAFKSFKSEKAALKCAYTRNQMFSTQVLNIKYLVLNQTDNTLKEAVINIKAA